MKTNFALAVVLPTDDPEVGSVRHLCFYEEAPNQACVNSLVEELRNDEEFGLTDLICDVDYVLMEYSGEELQSIKEGMKIPDDIDDIPEDFPFNVRTENGH